MKTPTVLLIIALASAVGCSSAATPAPVQVSALRHMSKHKGDYLPAHAWKVEIDGVIVGGFKSVDGLESEVEIVEYRDGDDPLTHKRPGKATDQRLVLERGFLASGGLRAWFEQDPKAPTERKSGSVIYLDRAGNEVLRYNLFECWPVASDVTVDEAVGVAVVRDMTLMVRQLEVRVDRLEMARMMLGGRHDTVKNAIGNIR